MSQGTRYFFENVGRPGGLRGSRPADAIRLPRGVSNGCLAVVLIGVGLMALVFYSSRRGYHEPSHFH